MRVSPFWNYFCERGPDAAKHNKHLDLLDPARDEESPLAPALARAQDEALTQILFADQLGKAFSYICYLFVGSSRH